MAARQLALIGFMDAVGKRLDQGLVLREGSPEAEMVQKVTDASPASLEEITAWCCVFWERNRQKGRQ